MGVNPKPTSASAFEALANLLHRHHLEGYGGDQQTRIIVLVGAGTSIWSRIRPSQYLKRVIFNRVSQLFRNAEDMKQEVLSSARQLPDAEFLERVSLEDICQAATRYGAHCEHLRQLLADHCNPWGDPSIAPPQLAYELLAHMVKHGFIDHIVSMNFDDVLDEAMRQELGQDGHYRVLTERDIPDKPSDLPHLVKLHGSVQAPNSLLFTQGQTQALTEPMRKLLAERILLDHERANYLVTLGYGFADEDVVTLINDNMDKFQRVVVVTRRPAPLKRISQLGKNKPLIINLRQLAGRSEPRLSIDHFLWALWMQIEAIDKGVKQAMKRAHLIPIARHLILSYLFGPAKPKMFSESLHDFWASDDTPQPPASKQDLLFRNQVNYDARLRVETLLHAIKCKGMINLSVMARDHRIDRFRQLASQPQILETLVSEGILSRSRTSHTRETYFLKAQHRDSGFANLFPCLGPSDTVVPHYDGRGISLKRKQGPVFLREQAMSIYKAVEVEVSRFDDTRAAWLFSRAQPMKTHSKVRWETFRTLETNWNILLVIAETGAWLTQQDFVNLLKTRLKKRKAGTFKIFCILAKPVADWTLGREHYDKMKWLKGRLGRRYEVKSARTDWWKHNRHLTLALELKQGRGIAGRGIYFRRRLKTSTIHPVAVEAEEDCRELLLIFMWYLLKCTRDAHAIHIARKLVSVARRVAQSIGDGDSGARLAKATADLRRFTRRRR